MTVSYFSHGYMALFLVGKEKLVFKADIIMPTVSAGANKVLAKVSQQYDAPKNMAPGKRYLCLNLKIVLLYEVLLGHKT